MPTDTISVSMLILATVAILASVVALLRTPINQWFSIKSHTLEEELRALPVSAQARVISRNRRRAVIQKLPWLIPIIPLACYAIATETGSDTPCMTFFGMNRGFVSLIMVSYALPGLILLYSLLNFRIGIKVLRYGYFPPLDSAQFRDTIAKKGVVSKVRGWVLVLLPVFALFIFYLGHDVYATISDGRSIQELHSTFADNCGS